MKKLLFFILLLLISAIGTKVKAIISAGFLMEEKLARAASMGDATLIEMFENKNFIKFGHITKWNDVNYEIVGINYFKEGVGNVGLELFVQYQKEFMIINRVGDIISTESIYDVSVGIKYGRNIISRFDGGVKFKYIKSKLINWVSDTVAFDFMGKCRLRDGIFLNIIVENVGYGLKFGETSRANNPLPTALKIGLNLLKNSILKNFNFFFNTRYYVYEGVQAGIGGEYCISELAFIRIGYKYFPENDLLGITTGVGINYKKLSISYAFIPGEVMGNIHKIYLKYNW